MATNFPGSADSFTNPTSGSSLSSPSHADQHTNVNDAVEAIETALLDGAPLHIDDVNERVGIGTTSPSAELDIRGASNPEIRLQSTDSTDPFLYFGDQVDAVRGGIGFDTSANALQLRGYNNSTRLTIDSSGRVTAPQQPYFMATGASWSSIPTGSGAAAKPPNVTQRNMGSYGYSNTTGYFYPPVDGLYLIGYEVGCYSSGSNAAYWRVSMRYNGTGFHDALSNVNYISTGTHDFIATSHIIYLTVGNYVSVNVDTAYSLTSYGGEKFYGVLIA